MAEILVNTPIVTAQQQNVQIDQFVTSCHVLTGSRLCFLSSLWVHMWQSRPVGPNMKHSTIECAVMTCFSRPSRYTCLHSQQKYDNLGAQQVEWSTGTSCRQASRQAAERDKVLQLLQSCGCGAKACMWTHSHQRGDDVTCCCCCYCQCGYHRQLQNLLTGKAFDEYLVCITVRYAVGPSFRDRVRHTYYLPRMGTGILRSIKQ